MTIEAITPRQDYFGDGVTTVFPILFPFQSAGDLSVYVAGELQLYGYSVSGIAGSAGGTLSFLQPPGAAQQITVLRSSTPAQSTSYSNGEVIADTLELSLDRIVMMVQWLYYEMERCIRFNNLSAGVSSLPYQYLDNHDNTLIGFDQYGNPELIPQTALIPLELATIGEAESGTNNTKALTPFTGRAGVYAMLASEEQAQAGTDTYTLMTPLRVAQAITTLAPAAGGGLSISTTGQAQAGTDDTTAMSPLKVVQSITARLATQVQAEALSDTSVLMTPLRTRQAIDVRLPVWYATQTQAQSGTDNATLMTPLRVAQAIAALAPVGGGSSLAISSTLQAQTGTDDTTAMSPWKVGQSISYRLATQAQAEALSDNTVLMTPARVANTLQYWKSTQAQAEAGTDYATFMTPLRTAQAIAALAPAGRSLASQAQAEAGTDNTTIMTPLRVVQGLTARQASQAQAQAGTDAYTLMTPLRTAQAIAALAPSGGGSLAISTTVQAQTGTDDTTAMSPLKVAQSITSRLATTAQAIDGANDTVAMSPLKVAQYVNYWKSTQADAEAGTSVITLMTPLRVAQAIAALAPSGGSTGSVNSITGYSPTSGSNTGPSVYVPNGVFSVGVATASIVSPYWGPGQIQTNDSISHGRFFFNQTAAVASPGSYDSINSAFSGGLGKSLFQIEHRLTGSTTLTQPTSGYVYVPTTSAMYIYSHNTSGWNQYTADQGGRTGGASVFIKADQYGQGDFAAITALCFVSGTKAGSTNFLANPAGVLYNGGMSAGTDGVYFNPRELYLDDSGHDVACIGDVVNLKRTVATGAKSALWMGYRVQSVGTQAVDSVMSATGSFMYGLDFALSGLTLTSNVAISLKAWQKINFSGTDSASGSLQSGWRTTATNGYAIYYDNTLPALVLLAGWTAALQVGPSYTFVTNTFKHTGTALGFFNGGPTGQSTGWGTPTNNAVVANFPGSSATLAQCGQAISQFITYFKQLGLLGA